jgi:hypothetical protein
MDLESPAYGWIGGIIGAIVVVAIAWMAGVDLASMSTLSGIAFIAVLVAFGGGMIGEYGIENWEWKKITVIFVSMIFVFGTGIYAMSQTSTQFTEGLGLPFGKQAPPPEDRDAESLMRGNVVDTLSDPQVGVKNATIKFYAEQPEDGVAGTGIYTDNSDSGGSFSKIVTEYPGTEMYVTAAKDNTYYSEVDTGTSGETGTAATNVTFDEYGKGLMKIGSLSLSLVDKEPSDNITLNGWDNIELDQGAGQFTFTMRLEPSDSATAIRDLLVELEDGGGYDTVNPAKVEFEVVTAEGDLSTEWTEGNPTWSDSVTDSVLEASGDLEYNNDLEIKVTIGSTDATGTVVEIETIDDLFDSTGVEGETGIPEQSLTIEVI